ncbi:NAD-dependent epimerase/dehydratase [Rhizobium sp. PDO1-076]|uniref:UDP-glucuronic acid decarboxylase family protein n=1 Tax=Rhizobium sp. PDO1-076 TaxID=1125979 RepID=UPI00024E21DD|nr:UDP-glucuronic acid decarboxylase family protein [Rhizobium sp. PDO1-076]EHS51256.1 NAD-dependent epimerase/dehydratase [Rhizobium sp. PDO1-076]
MQIRDGSDGDTIVVAGGAGFLGSHLCEKLLGHGHGVICVDSFLTGSQKNIAHLRANQGFSLIEHDICDPLEIDEQIDRIYNLACAASPPSYQADPFHTMMTCVKGTGNLLLLAEQHGARFLQASTSEIYGDPEIHPQTEEYRGSVNCTGPRACYDEGKRAAEALCFDLFRLGRVDARVARLFNTYGPRMQPDDGRIVSNLVVQALSGRALTLYGTGHQTRSFCYVSDMIRGLVALMEREPNPALPINLGNPDEFSICELAEMVQREIPTSKDVVYLPLPIDDPRRRQPDIRRAVDLLDWRPEIPLEEGLRHTIDWFKQMIRPADLQLARLEAASAV